MRIPKRIFLAILFAFAVASTVPLSAPTYAEGSMNRCYTC